MAALVSRPSSLPSAPPSLPMAWEKASGISDPPDHESARDDVLFVAREHLRLAGFVHAPPHIEQSTLDRWAREVSSAGPLVCGAQGTPEAGNEYRLSLLYDYCRGAENELRQAPAYRR